jgi:hypothetical protein
MPIATAPPNPWHPPVEDLHPAIAHFIPLFGYEHLPANLATVSRPFAELAGDIMRTCAGQEATAGLRKLLEAKDCIVRAHVLAAREIS